MDFDVEATKIFVCRNGHASTTKEVRLPGASKIADLLEKSGKALDLDNPQIAFYSNGVECTDVDHLVDHEVLHISCGEPFKESKSNSQGGSLQMCGNYILHEKLGEGGFGSVVKGVHSETGDLAAVKFVAKKSMRQLSDLHRVFSEIQSLRNLKHQNVISIIDVVEHPDAIVFIMEFAGGGELRNYVEKNGPLGEEESRVFFKQIVRAVHYVHSKKIIHRDLKLENILLNKDGRCKIVDFGLADYVSSNQRTVTDAGTEAYLAPEVLNGTSGDADPYKIDVWSLGVILYALAHRKLPFNRADAETCAVLDAQGPPFREDVTERFKRLDREMLTPDPDRRASIDNITTDTWVAGRRFAHSGTCDDQDEFVADEFPSELVPGADDASLDNVVGPPADGTEVSDEKVEPPRKSPSPSPDDKAPASRAARKSPTPAGSKRSERAAAGRSTSRGARPEGSSSVRAARRAGSLRL